MEADFAIGAAIPLLCCAQKGTLKRLARRVLFYALLYAVCMARMGTLERRLMRDATKQYRSICRAQSLDVFPTNVIKAGVVAATWPILCCAPSSVFVETGFFSMLCFAVACSSSPNGTVAASSKLFWHKVGQHSHVRVPELYGVANRAGAVFVANGARGRSGVRKPLRGMYGWNVRRDTVANFVLDARDELIQEEVAGMDCAKACRVCTLHSAQGCCVISAFFATGKRVPSPVWSRIMETGRQLARAHESHVHWAPLVAWDLVVTDDDIVMLEGNLGGALGSPMCATVGWVADKTATSWRERVRTAAEAGFYRNSVPRSAA